MKTFLSEASVIMRLCSYREDLDKGWDDTWSLVETYRTERGPRQRVVSYIGDSDEQCRKSIKAAAEESPRVVEGVLFDEDLTHDWQDVVKPHGGYGRNARRRFGDWWVGLWLLSQKLGLSDELEDF